MTDEAIAPATPVAWALWDTDGKCWIGDDTGPTLYTEPLESPVNGFKLSVDLCVRLAAQILSVRLGNDPLRVEARIYDGTGNKQKDAITPKRDAVAAIRLIEKGGV